MCISYTVIFVIFLIWQIYCKSVLINMKQLWTKLANIVNHTYIKNADIVIEGKKVDCVPGNTPYVGGCGLNKVMNFIISLTALWGRGGWMLRHLISPE